MSNLSLSGIVIIIYIIASIFIILGNEGVLNEEIAYKTGIILFGIMFAAAAIIVGLVKSTNRQAIKMEGIPNTIIVIAMIIGLSAIIMHYKNITNRESMYIIFVTILASYFIFSIMTLSMTKSNHSIQNYNITKKVIIKKQNNNKMNQQYSKKETKLWNQKKKKS